MARRLADWREDEARRLNRPLRQVLRDDLLVAIAKRQPTNRRGLEALRDFNRPALLNRSQEILAILEEARAVHRRTSFPISHPATKSLPGFRPSPTCSPLRSRSAVHRTRSPDRSWPMSPISKSWSAGTSTVATVAPAGAPARLASRLLRPALAGRDRRAIRLASGRARERVPGRRRAARRAVDQARRKPR